MRRLWRWCIYGLTVISVVLLATTVAMWVRSEYVVYEYGTAGAELDERTGALICYFRPGIALRSGGIEYMLGKRDDRDITIIERHEVDLKPVEPHEQFKVSPNDGTPFSQPIFGNETVSLWGFGTGGSAGQYSSNEIRRIPLWPIVAIEALMPSILLARATGGPVRRSLHRHPAALHWVRQTYWWIFTSTAAVSLALCIAAILTMIRSLTVSDTLQWRTNIAQSSQLSTLTASRGGLNFEFSSIELPPVGLWYAAPNTPSFVRNKTRGAPSYPSPQSNIFTLSSPGCRFHAAGFAFALSGCSSLFSLREVSLIVPLPAFIIFFLLLPLFWLRMKKHNPFDDNKSLCQSCGYDLRASIDRCPECGKAIQSGKKFT